MYDITGGPPHLLAGAKKKKKIIFKKTHTHTPKREELKIKAGHGSMLQ